MAKPLARRLDSLGTENAYVVSDEARALAATGKKVYSLHIGDLNFGTAPPVISACKKALDDGKTGYCSAGGVAPLREAIAKHVSRDRRMSVTSDMVTVQPGGKPVIWKFLGCTMDEGDEVLYPSPGYPIYESMVNFLGGVPKPYIYKETSNGFVLDMDYLRSQISSKTKVLIYNNLHNPTGHCSSAEEMAEISQIAIDNDLWVLADEAYFHISYDKGHPTSIASLPGMQERTVMLVTTSKTWGMTGWRLGCAVGPTHIIDMITKFNINDEGCTTHFVQFAAIEAFQDASGECAKFNDEVAFELRKRRDLICERVNRIPGMHCYVPRATFYCWVNATKAFRILGTDDYTTFRRTLLHDTGVSFCTRDHFGAPLPQEKEKYVRFAFSGISCEDIEKAMDILQQYMEKREKESRNRKLPRVFVTRQMPKIAFEMMDGVVDFEVWEGEDAPPRDLLLEKVKDCDGLIPLLTDAIDEELLAAAPNLRVVCQMAVGYNNIDVDACTRHKVLVTNTPGVLTDTVVETTMALILAASRRIVESDKYVRDGKWKVSWHPMMQLGHDINGSTLGIIGMGRIGRKVAEVCAVLGAKIIYYDRNVDQKYEANTGFSHVSLDELCKRSDFISIHTSLNPETRHLINAEKLALMKPSCVLVNTSRGPVVDQGALTKALKEEKLFAAALDVFEQEPVDTSDELLKLSNVVVLPHLGSASWNTRSAMARLAAANMVAYWSGKDLPNLVNKDCEDARK